MIEKEWGQDTRLKPKEPPVAKRETVLAIKSYIMKSYAIR
jgi:hypothetical protein